MYRKIIVYGSTRVIANQKMQSLLDKMNPDEIKKVRKSNSEFAFEMNNGDYYLSLSASDNARGHRWQYAYIDENIDFDTIERIIIPCYRSEDLTSNWNYEGHFEYYF
jgi:hypothetical protein